MTRCPIRLVMRKAKTGEKWGAVLYTSLDPQRIKAENISDLNNIMSKLMNDLCGSGDNTFSFDSVIIELVSPDCCDLTVVDLPGIVRTATAGQSASVIEQVNKLIKSYLTDRRTVILAIIPANQDIATIDILERAQSVDPAGDRTIGVLTKCDLINPGGEDEVMAVITNVRKPLKLGYVMLKNRSQKELNENISNKEARCGSLLIFICVYVYVSLYHVCMCRLLEERFFASHPVFKHASAKLFGINNLADKLTNLLVHRIKLELVSHGM